MPAAAIVSSHVPGPRPRSRGGGQQTSQAQTSLNSMHISAQELCHSPNFNWNSCIPASWLQELTNREDSVCRVKHSVAFFFFFGGGEEEEKKNIL